MESVCQQRGGIGFEAFFFLDKETTALKICNHASRLAPLVYLCKTTVCFHGSVCSCRLRFNIPQDLYARNRTMLATTQMYGGFQLVDNNIFAQKKTDA